MSFRDLGLPQPILQALDDAGYVNPTDIQAQAIPPALEGRDVLGRAKTGTGKTAAFALPILTRMKALASWDPAAHAPEPEEIAGGEEASAGESTFAERSRRRRRRKRAPLHAHHPGPPADKRPVRALILTPTRELCVQNEESFRAYGKYLDLRFLAVYGGVRID